MLQRPSRREVKRENQRRYAARARQGIGLYYVPLTRHEIATLIDLNYLREGAESDHASVGEAVATAIRSLRR